MTEIVYVPGADNHYKYGHDVVVLDEHLKDYPKAHEYIKNHELEHAEHGQPENRGFIELLRLEFRTDVSHYFGDGDDVEQVREYFDAEKEEQPLKRTEYAMFSLADFLRGWWNFLMSFLSILYDLVKR